MQQEPDHTPASPQKPSPVAWSKHLPGLLPQALQHSAPRFFFSSGAGLGVSGVADVAEVVGSGDDGAAATTDGVGVGGVLSGAGSRGEALRSSPPHLHCASGHSPAVTHTVWHQ